MDDKLKKIGVPIIAGIAVLGAGFVIFKTMNTTSNTDGAAESAKQILKQSNKTDVLPPDKQEFVRNAGRGPGSVMHTGKPAAATH